MESLIVRLGWKVQVPNYSVINRRHKDLPIAIKGSNKEHKYVVIDSTGAKVYGEGEWKVRQHGWSKHRIWRKIHLAVDESTAEIESCAMTANSVDNAAVVATLLDQTAGTIKKVAADGAYDKKKVYRELEKRKIKPIIHPRKGARITKHGNCAGSQLPHKAIRQIRKWGRKQWKNKTGYHQRSIAESAIFRLKTIFGPKLSSRQMQQQQVEVSIRCYALNKMAELGMPQTIKVKVAA